MVIGEPQRLVHVSENPSFEGVLKTGTIMIPVDAYRDLSVLVNNIPKFQRIHRDEFFYMPGDSIHAGKTNPRPEPGTDANWFPCLHFFVDSLLHPRNRDLFGLELPAIGIHSPIHLPYLDTTTQVEIIDDLANSTLKSIASVLEGATATKHKRVRKLGEEFYDNLGRILHPQQAARKRPAKESVAPP